jgi:CRP-like cAMP-binding protein
MNEFIEYILRFGSLNQQQIELILSKATELELREGEYFSEAGKISQQFGIIIEGVTRVFDYNNKGEEITKYFIDESNFIVGINSYNQDVPSSVYIQAITDCKFMVFSKESMKELSMTILIWDDIVNKIINKALMEKVKKIGPMLTEDATERYLNFLKNFPQLSNRIPLSYLASYLGVTQSSLSRIRKNIR